MNGSHNEMTFSTDIGAIESITLTKLYMEELAPEQNMFYRPWTINTTGNDLNKLVNVVGMVKESGAGIVQGSAIAGTVSNMLTPSIAKGVAPIPEGWGTTRIRFKLEVDINYAAGFTIVNRIQGFTTFHDPSFSGKLDPNMVFVINSINSYRRDVHRGFATESLRSADQVVLQYSDTLNADKFMMRPQDVFTAMTVNELTYDPDLQSGNHVNITSAATNAPKFSAISNQSPGSYIAKLLNSYQQAKDQAAMGFDAVNLNANASIIAKETMPVQNEFIKRLSEMLNSFGSTGEFTYNDLITLDPTLDGRTTMVTLDKGMRPVTSYESVSMQDLSTTISFQGTCIMASILTSSGLTGLDFSVSNMTTDGSMAINIIRSVADSAGSDLAQLTARAARLIEYELMPTVTRDGLISLQLDVSANKYMSTTVKVMLEGERPKEYSLPTYANATFLPELTPDQKDLSMLGYSLDNVLSAVNLSANNNSLTNGIVEL